MTTKLFRKYSLVLALSALASGCTGALQGGTIGGGGSTPGVKTHAVGLTVRDDHGPIAAAVCGLAGVAEHGPDSDVNGTVIFPAVPLSLRATQLTCNADGYQPFSEHRDLTGADPEPALVALLVKLPPPHVDPSNVPLAELAAIRGAMWPQTLGACGNLPIGPRPGQPTNIIATVFITDYAEADQACIIAELKRRGYTHVVMGPLVDSDGYHGTWQPNDWRGANFDRFLDAVQKFWDNGLTPVVFLKPDNWTLEQTKAELTPLLSQPRAKKLLRVRVPMGWEAGAAYEYSSCTWAEAGRWVNELLGEGITLVHMVSDRDAPAGTDARCNDDDHAWNPGGNAAAWGRVAPFYHGWLVQYGAFDKPTQTGCDRAVPTKTNFDCFQDTFRPEYRGSYRNRFEHGYAGWPTSSAWGTGKPIRVFYGEGTAYWRFWGGRSEAEGVTWGDAAMAAGAYGYLDGGSVNVPVRP